MSLDLMNDIYFKNDLINIDTYIFKMELLN